MLSVCTPRSFATARRPLFLLAVLFVYAAATMAAANPGEALLRQAGVHGGLIVHLGCGEGELTCQLGDAPQYLVHGLAAAEEDVVAARRRVEAEGLVGRVTIERWTHGHLPYADNLVRAVVVGEAGGVPDEEITRVLAPGGVVCRRNGDRWTTTVKPWPAAIDQWTHYLHDGSGNAVAADSVVGPPRHLQWVGPPRHGRSHEIDTTVCAAVSADGRIFAIVDDGLTGITDQRLPQTWSLVARDAFCGVQLWRRAVPDWGWRQWKRSTLEGKDWTTLRGQRTKSPSTLPRRLVAIGDRVFVTLGHLAPLTILDAATGEVLHRCDDTAGVDELVADERLVVLSIRQGDEQQTARRTGQPSPCAIAAVDPTDGRVQWRAASDRVVPLTLALTERSIVFHDGAAMVCLERESGRQQWRSPFGVGKKGGCTLVVYDDVVLLSGGGKVHAVDLASGEALWNGKAGGGPGVANPPDLFVAGGLVWTGKDGNGRDPRTGEVRRTLELPPCIITVGHHFRCYRSKATEQFLLWPKRGVEFIDLDGEQHMKHDWLRAPCKLGMMPCNGLLYVPPHQCFCYPGVKLSGFHALAASRQSSAEKSPEFQRGPAFDEPVPPGGAAHWPTHRHDAARSGATEADVPSALSERWQTQLGGRLTQPVVVGQRLLIASVDAHRVHCLATDAGRPIWQFTAAGRVDSPPSVHQGRVLLGSADGWVYCLRLDDGRLIWRRRAAPDDRRIVAFDQLESTHPVHGSVLIWDDLAYVAAGRSSYLDGGIVLLAIDPATGNVLHRARVDGPHPDVETDPGRPFDMEGALADVLTTDGTHLFMQQNVFDRQLGTVEAPRLTNMGDRRFGRHVFSTAGLLDDSGWNRTFWMNTERWPGFYIANQAPKTGQLLSVDRTTTYGVKYFTRRNRHSPMLFPATDGYLLFADDNENEPLLYDGTGKPAPLAWLPPVSPAIGHKLQGRAVDFDKGTGFTRAAPPKWGTWVPIRIRAMVAAGGTLFIAGPPDALPADDPLAAFEGRAGGKLWAVDTQTGQRLAAFDLDSPPVFDGLIATPGRLYAATRAGKLMCLGE